MIDLEYSWKPAPHTADLAIAVRAKKPEGLFRAVYEALLSLCGVTQDLQNSNETIEHTLTLVFTDIEEGLVDFLNECIYLMDGEELVPFRINHFEYSPGKITAVFLCRKVLSHEIPTITHIKAATYSDLKVERSDNGFSTQIIFDT